MTYDQRTRTGQEIEARDWQDTRLGPPAGWPPALRSLVAMMLACPTPMFLAWGPDLNAFFNDAYRPILGNRAPGALGKPFRQLWGDIWDDIGPLVDATLAGESRSMIDMKLDLQRTGVPEESWWSFTYSPVFDDHGDVAGLFCVTGETTDRVVAEREREAADERLQLALSAGNSIGAWDWDTATDLVVADARFALLYGVDTERAATGTPIADFFRCIHPDDLGRVQAEIAEAQRTGEVFSSEYRLVRDGRIHWVSAQGRCVADATGRCSRFPGVSFDITQRKRAELAVAAAKDERDFVVSLSAEQRDLAAPETILERSMAALGWRLGADRCGFYRHLVDGELRYGPCWTSGRLPPILGEVAGERFGERLRLAREEGVVVAFADARSDPVGGLDELIADGVLAGICQPIMQDGIITAGIFVHCATPRDWADQEIALVREVAEATIAAVERAEALVRLEHRLGQQEYALALQAGELRDQAAGRTAAESQVRQLQKMEAVGQLTGGIAHDFNNMLAVIIGGLNLIQRRIEKGDFDVGRYADAAMEAATRATALTQRLLAFSRQSPLKPEPIYVNAMIDGLTELLTRTLGERIRLDTLLGIGRWMAKADRNQLENVIVNLAVNARDAMPDGGLLTIETDNVAVSRVQAAEEGIAPGGYVLVAITDTGTGMTPRVMARAFDPFFTTKGVGKGTGLGLSQVFGFIRQSGGHVRLDSEVGRGTTVRIFLPRTRGAAAPAPTLVRPVSANVPGGSADEVVMVVEDEERLRNLTVEALRELGYTVVHAADGTEALALIQRGQSADLLFTDIVMPGITGRQLAEAATAQLPGIKILFTTGYARDAAGKEEDTRANVLHKPYDFAQLGSRIRDALDG